MSAADRLTAIRRGAARAAIPYVRRLSPEAEAALRALARRATGRGAGGDRPGPSPSTGGASPSTGGAGDRPEPSPSAGGGPASDTGATGSIRPVPSADRRRLRLRGGPTVILMYHRIADDADAFRLAVRPERFAAQMEMIRLFAEPVPLAAVTRPARGPRVAVTFDDGYADNALTALGALRAADVPATVFVTSAMVDSPSTMWPLRLERLFRSGRPRSGGLHLTLGGTDVVVPLSSAVHRKVSMYAVHDRLRDLPPADVATALSDIEAQFDDVPPDPARRMLTRGELLGLAADDLVTIGAHTRRHPQLSRLSAAGQREEIEGSRADLEGILGRPVTEFAYPYGTRASFDRRSVRAVGQAGFSVACTTIADPLVAGTSPLRLPRRMALDWDPPEFAAHLEQWLAA